MTVQNSKITKQDCKDSRRQPTQDRSKKRVDSILRSAKSLIAEKGSAQLKIHEIAERAGVTSASIYQYFPSKKAITLALAQEAFDQAYFSLANNLPAMTSTKDACQVLQEIIEQHYQTYLSDPALIDIWASVSADKSMQNLDIEDSRRFSALIFQSIKQFYDEIHWEELARVGFLLSHMAGATVRMSLTVGEEEGRALIDSFKNMINPAAIDSLLKLKH